MTSEYLEHKLSLLPPLPGCYIMKDKNGKIIYIGKAKSLKNRVRSYFKSKHTGKTAKLVANINDFETIVTSNDKEAFLLEITLIQKYYPYFNIKLKNSNSGYPYIKITNEKDPRLTITNRIKKDGGYYFGPYPNVYAAEETLNFLQKVYPLKRCSGFQNRPCLYYHMGQCLGACFKEVDLEVYKKQIRRIKSFLHGNVAFAKKVLKKRMKEAANKLEYERAAEIRDQLHYINVTVEKQKIISHDNTARDIFNFYAENGWVSLQIFFIRQARLIKREKKVFPIVSSASEEVTNYIVQFYRQKNRVWPKEILVPKVIDTDVLKNVLKLPIRIPQRGQKKALLEMAFKNAKLVLDEKFRLLELDHLKTEGAVKELTQLMDIKTSVNRIEAFDHSHISGTDLVSALVVFENGRPNKKMYRKYKLRTVEHADEAASTKEVIRRRYVRLLKEHAKMPDLILIDGGEIQLNAVRDVLENELNLAIPVAAMVKNAKHATSDLLDGFSNKALHLNPHTASFHLVQRIQNEVHRFAINYHHQLHNKNSFSSRLESIKGVGPKTRSKLLSQFGSIKKIAAASLEDLRKAGITETLALTIKLYFKNVPLNTKNKIK